MFKIETGKDNTVLRTVSEEVKMSEIKKIAKLGKKMVKYIKDPDNGGVGLAAPQIGINKRLIVVSLFKDREDEDVKTIMMINPKIVSCSEEKLIDEEGCLSVPGEKGKVERFKEITLSFLNDNGKEKKIILDLLSARIVQHEIDHLNGVLFTDKLSSINT